MSNKVYIQNGNIFYEPYQSDEAAFIANGGLFYQPGRPALTNIKMILPDGQILMTGPATYTAQAAGGLGIPIAAYHYNHHLRR